MAATAKTLMREKLLTVNIEDSVAYAYKLMKENSIRHLPVRDDEGEICGILSHRDVMRAAESKMSFEFGFFYENIRVPTHLLVEDYMTSPVESLPSDTPLKLVAKKMLEFKISSFLITENGEVVGIVTSDDLLKYLAFTLEGTSDDWKLSLKSLFSEPFTRFANAAGNA